MADCHFIHVNSAKLNRQRDMYRFNILIFKLNDFILSEEQDSIKKFKVFGPEIIYNCLKYAQFI